MKCLGVDISRPLFEFLTSLSRQPPLVIQYNGCQVSFLPQQKSVDMSFSITSKGPSVCWSILPC